MATLKPWMYAEYALVDEAFGSTTVPTVTMSETMREAWRIPGRVPSGVRYDEALGCLYLEPRLIHADEALGQWTVTGGTCKAVTNRVTGKACIRQTAAPAGEWTATKGEAGDEVLYDGQGLHVWLYRDAPLVSGPTPANCYASVVLMADGGADGYRVHWPHGLGPRLERTGDGGVTWDMVADLPLGDGGRAQTGAWGEILIEVMRVNGRLAFRCGQNNGLNERAVGVDLLDLRYPITIAGRGLNAAWSAARCGWPDSGTFSNSTREMPWNNTAAPAVRVHGSVNSDPDAQDAPDGVSCTLARDTSAWAWNYTLALAAQDAGEDEKAVTPYVTMVRAVLPSVQVAPTTPTWYPLPYVDGYRLQHVFSPQENTVRIQGALHVYNHGGQWRETYGARAVRIWAGMADEQGPLWGGYGQPDGLRFVGLMNLDQDIGAEEGWVSLDSRLYQVERKSFLHGPHFDYDCIWHTVRVALQHAGIHDASLMVAPGAPADCWACDGVTCNPATHYRLGGGTGYQPRWRPEQGESVWAFLQRLRSRYGMALGFRHDGMFTMHPWEPWTARTAWTPRQVFGAAPAYDSGGRPMLNEALQGARKQVSMRSMVNSLTLLGLDSETWRPLVAHAYDEASIQVGPGAVPVNYMGFLADAVESDIAYANAGQMDTVLARLFNVVRQPRVSFSPFPVHAQPLHVTDFVGVDATLGRMLPGADQFWVSGIGEAWETMPGQLGASAQRYTMNLTLDMVPYDPA